MQQATANRVSALVPRATLAMGGLGAIIGGTGAAAKNIRRVKNKEIEREDAVRDTLRESAGTGLATAAGTAVIGVAGVTGLLSLAGMLAVATGAKYLWDTATNPAQLPVGTSAEKKQQNETKSKKSS
jgi:hypothetical protein